MDARLFEQFAGGGGAQRFVSSVERAGDGLPETRLVGPLDEQDLQVGGVDDDEDGFGDFVRHTVAYRKPGTGTCCLSPILFTGWSKRGQAAVWQRVPVPPSFYTTLASALRKRICSSRNCFSSTSDGALVKRSCARWVLGKAITSRIESEPVIMVTMRSRPKARPPCGGAPYCRASSRKPNFSCASSASIFRARNTLLWTSSRWIRIEPPPSSQPFKTMS